MGTNRLKRTDKEIFKKIKELSEDSDNFMDDNFGSEACDNGYYQAYHSKTLSYETLVKFYQWLIEK